MIKYYDIKQRPVKDKEIKTTIYNILRNTEAIGQKTMDYNILIQRCGEHLEEIRLIYTTQQIIDVIDEMLKKDLIYRVSSENEYKVGLTR